MRISLSRLLLAATLLATAPSCATLDLTPAATSMPAARAGLNPEFRFFYDALREDGDWVLIEPFGWVFRPRVNWVAWRPYQTGYWAPSDIYGWTWVSAESFGWATYHYGQWMFDDFEGWVWVPGLDWGPAWVTWQESNGYVGWAPQTPNGLPLDHAPGGAYLFVPTQQLVATDLSSRASVAADVGKALGSPEPADHIVVRNGVKINRGPRFEDIEQATGQPLSRVAIDARTPSMGGGARHGASGSATWTAADSTAAIRRAGADAAREARDVSAAKLPAPSRVAVVRVAPAKHAPHAESAPPSEGAAPDSTR